MDDSDSDIDNTLDEQSARVQNIIRQPSTKETNDSQNKTQKGIPNDKQNRKKSSSDNSTEFGHKFGQELEKHVQDTFQAIMKQQQKEMETIQTAMQKVLDELSRIREQEEKTAKRSVEQIRKEHAKLLTALETEFQSRKRELEQQLQIQMQEVFQESEFRAQKRVQRLVNDQLGVVASRSGRTGSPARSCSCSHTSGYGDQYFNAGQSLQGSPPQQKPFTASGSMVEDNSSSKARNTQQRYQRSMGSPCSCRGSKGFVLQSTRPGFLLDLLDSDDDV